MVKRYDVYVDIDGTMYEDEDLDGKWVKYEDHENIVSELQLQIESLDARLYAEQMRAYYEND